MIKHRTIRADIESGEEALGLLKKFAGNDARIKYFNESLTEATNKKGWFKNTYPKIESSIRKFIKKLGYSYDEVRYSVFDTPSFLRVDLYTLDKIDLSSKEKIVSVGEGVFGSLGGYVSTVRPKAIEITFKRNLTEDNEPLKEDFWSLHHDLIKDKKITEVKAGELLYVQNGMNDVCVGEYLGDAHIVTMNWDQPGKRYKSYEYSVRVVLPLSKRHRVGSITNGFTSGYVSVFESTIEDIKNESLKEDTIKQNKKWVNKGREGTHGKFRTKKAADAQRKAMFANGYKEGLEEGTNKFYNPFFIESAYSDYLADKYDDSYYAVYDEDADIIEVYHNDDKINELSVKNAENICIKYGNLKVYKEGLKEARAKRPNPENIKELDSGYADNKEDWLRVKKEQIAKYKKDYPNVKCELVRTDTPGLKMWHTYTLKEGLKEATTKQLTAQDKSDIKNKLNTTNDSELITAYVASKGAKKKDTNQTSVTESIDGLSNSATDIVMGLYDNFPEINFIDERDLDNNQVGLIFEGASKVDPVDLGIYLDGLYVWYKIKGDKLLIKADEDANYLEEDNNSFYDPYVTIDAEYEEEDF